MANTTTHTGPRAHDARRRRQAAEGRRAAQAETERRSRRACEAAGFNPDTGQPTGAENGNEGGGETAPPAGHPDHAMYRLHRMAATAHEMMADGHRRKASRRTRRDAIALWTSRAEEAQAEADWQNEQADRIARRFAANRNS